MRIECGGIKVQFTYSPGVDGHAQGGLDVQEVAAGTALCARRLVHCSFMRQWGGSQSWFGLCWPALDVAGYFFFSGLTLITLILLCIHIAILITHM